MAETTTGGTFNFELVSPERKLISGPAKLVVIPGEEGDFGVLPGHSALVASIRAGVVEITMADSDAVQRVFIAGGFADVSPTNCTVLAEEAVNVNDLNQADLEQTIRNLTEDLTLAKDDLERSRVTRKLVLTKAKLQGLTGRAVA
ncbi:MAG: ATP synthase F1 subunit epsilon [Micavibrio sp.]